MPDINQVTLSGRLASRGIGGKKVFFDVITTSSGKRKRPVEVTIPCAAWSAAGQVILEMEIGQPLTVSGRLSNGNAGVIVNAWKIFSDSAGGIEPDDEPDDDDAFAVDRTLSTVLRGRRNRD